MVYAQQDCNSCSRRECNGRKDVCSGRIVPGGKFKLWEIAIEHPQGLIDTELYLRNTGSQVTLRISDYMN